MTQRDPDEMRDDANEMLATQREEAERALNGTHTRGPWKVRHAPGMSNPMVIAPETHRGQYDTLAMFYGDDAEANATLFAGSPTLLAAAQRVLDKFLADLPLSDDDLLALADAVNAATEVTTTTWAEERDAAIEAEKENA